MPVRGLLIRVAALVVLTVALQAVGNRVPLPGHCYTDTVWGRFGEQHPLYEIRKVSGVNLTDRSVMSAYTLPNQHWPTMWTGSFMKNELVDFMLRFDEVDCPAAKE